MCGLVGLFKLNENLVSELEAQNLIRTLSHRGPDSSGIWVKRHYGVGSCRLSIVDVTDNGNQPMHSRDQRYILAYNGELYNYKELRVELKSLGYVFTSNSDTEVILYSLIHWGQESLVRFNGMFSIAFFDSVKEELLLARDRYGVKPLYFTLQDNIFFYASEYKAIISHPNFKKKLNINAMYEYLTFQNLISAKTLISEINLVPAGSFLIISRTNSSPKVFGYWDFRFSEPEKALSSENYEEELDRLLGQAVDRQLMGEKEIGCYLSSGLDSTFITHTASKKIIDLKTFTCGFDMRSTSNLESNFDESLRAKSLSGGFKTKHFEKIISQLDMQNSMSRLIWHLEDPRMGQSYPNYYAAKLASAHVKIVLSGTGGDELFGGYTWRYHGLGYTGLRKDFNSYYFQRWQRLLEKDNLLKLLEPVRSNLSEDLPRELFNRLLEGSNIDPKSKNYYANQVFYFEAKTFLHGLLIVEDKLSMAHSIETRLPFLDNDLVDFAIQLPLSLKVNYTGNLPYLDENDWIAKANRENLPNIQGKILLRKVLMNKIPKDIVLARKQGFSGPDSSWYRNESSNYVHNKLSNPKNILYNFLNRGEVLKIFEDHKLSLKNNRLLLWSLLSLEEWMNAFIK